MNKTLVVYYSKTGNNRYLAEKTAEALGCPSAALRPRLPGLLFLLPASATKISLGNRRLKETVSDYDEVILCGPIWMGMFVSP